MTYKLDFSELDIDLINRIQYTLDYNMDCLEIFEGLEIDDNIDYDMGIDI